MNSFELYGDMLKIYKEVDLQCGYKLDNMLQKINVKGALYAAKSLIRDDDDNGLEILISSNKEELSLERLILDKKYKNIFDDEDREICNNRLRRYRNIDKNKEE
ncbi:hypothetical protein K5V21_17800 [Clostridium sardiniense]|uniref:Uncharacterized protein n=1 Tax=Clostridium sardiniense TaxID=29369 RepID=A0ABS7L2I5_CLOSR|nr:hypothetical protein [Clostridium sardiniense]MBY0757289.1 hypothetical protein [Clostridium sardiniense]MDQ0461613.1 hypothetical protein [Clostridium sardiniense]